MELGSSSKSRSSTQSQCVKGCGFFASTGTRNMCAKCHRDDLVEQLLTKFRSPEFRDYFPNLAKKNNRCENCNKKVGLTGFNCRCGKLLCETHRYPKEHSCGFDFKTFDRRVLANQNLLVKADKLDYRI